MEVTTRFVLVGGYAGQTVNLGGHQFIDGVFEYGPNADNVIPSEDERRLKADFLAKSYQAYPEGSQALAEAEARLTAPKSEGVDVGEREKVDQGIDEASQAAALKAHEEAKAADVPPPPPAPSTTRAENGKVRTALTKLDPANDEHWTDAGLPSVAAVRELSGVEVSRADISSLAPKLTRDEAKKAQSDPLDD